MTSILFTTQDVHSPFAKQNNHHTTDKPGYLSSTEFDGTIFTGVLNLIYASTSDGQALHLEVFLSPSTTFCIATSGVPPRAAADEVHERLSPATQIKYGLNQK
jgi:hypothetical protein